MKLDFVPFEDRPYDIFPNDLRFDVSRPQTGNILGSKKHLTVEDMSFTSSGSPRPLKPVLGNQSIIKTGGLKPLPIDVKLGYPPGGLNPDITIDTFTPTKTITSTPRSLTRVISGKVVDELGQPMPSATISMVGNTPVGTETNFDGEYSLSIPKNAAVQVRYQGYKTLVFKQVPDVIKMIPTTTVLNEVNIPAKKKKSNTLLYAGIGIAALALLALAGSSDDKKKASGMNGAATKGKRADGKLKKGYRYGRGGKLVKAGSKKAKSTPKKVSL